jgi:hypothetical protein
MIICAKCGKEKVGVGSKKIFYFTLAATPFLVYFLGISLALLPIYAFCLMKFYQTNNYVCGKCRPKHCPTCSAELVSGMKCRNCKILVCPSCHATQHYDTSVSWPAAVAGCILLPVVMGLGLVLSGISIMFFHLVYLLY